MILDHHERFERMIDESLVGAISLQDERSLREHLAICAGCTEYLSASKRVLAGLSGFSFEVNSSLSTRILEALTLMVERGRMAQAGRWGFLHQHHLPRKALVAFAGALSLSFAGSAFVYQMARRLALSMHIGAARVETGVLVLWLLPSLCAVFCLLAAPDENRGME